MKQHPTMLHPQGGKRQSGDDLPGGQSRAFHEENARNRELREHNQTEKKGRSKASLPRESESKPD